MSKTCSDQQQLIHQAINKTPANTTEACLQHEITRLTGENFDLREKIENLNENVKRLKRMLKSYMKRLEEAGENPNEIHPVEDHGNMYDEQVEQSIVIRMKDHTEYLGMFEYKKDNEQRIFKALVYGKLGITRDTYLLFYMVIQKNVKHFGLQFCIKIKYHLQ